MVGDIDFSGHRPVDQDGFVFFQAFVLLLEQGNGLFGFGGLGFDVGDDGSLFRDWGEDNRKIPQLGTICRGEIGCFCGCVGEVPTPVIRFEQP